MSAIGFPITAAFYIFLSSVFRSGTLVAPVVKWYSSREEGAESEIRLGTEKEKENHATKITLVERMSKQK